MKKIAALICVWLCLLVVGGCSPFTGIPKTDDEWGIVLVAKDVTPTGMTIVCAQRGVELDGDLLSGEYYRLEMPKDDTWVRVRGKGVGGWTAAGWIIRENGVIEWKQSWENMYGALEPGQYRIVKEISYIHAPGDYEEKEYFAEFTIE